MYLHFLRAVDPIPDVGTKISTGWEESQFMRNKRVDWQNFFVLNPVQRRFAIDRALESGGPIWMALYVAKRINSNADMNVEAIFERVREERFPDRPSRFACMFLFDETLGAKTFASTMGITGTRPLVRVVPVHGAKVRRVRMSTLDCVNRPHGEITASAERYWTEDPGPVLDSEVLLAGSVEVVEVMQR